MPLTSSVLYPHICNFKKYLFLKRISPSQGAGHLLVLHQMAGVGKRHLLQLSLERVNVRRKTRTAASFPLLITARGEQAQGNTRELTLVEKIRKLAG